MTINEIRAASAQEFARVRAEAALNAETTPPAITPAILSFARDVLGGDPTYIPVVNDAYGLYGWCSDGVQQKVEADGGEPVFGWSLWEWSGALITAEFHAVWQDRQGALLDINPKPRGETSILFVADHRYPADFDFDQRPRNRRARLYEAADRNEQARTMATALSGAQRSYEERRASKAGLPLDEWMLRKVPVDPLPVAIDDLIAACNAFEEHHDSLGMSGFIVPDQKLAELAGRRFAAQSRFKALYSARLR